MDKTLSEYLEEALGGVSSSEAVRLQSEIDAAKAAINAVAAGWGISASYAPRMVVTLVRSGDGESLVGVIPVEGVLAKVNVLVDTNVDPQDMPSQVAIHIGRNDGSVDVNVQNINQALRSNAALMNTRVDMGNWVRVYPVKPVTADPNTTVQFLAGTLLLLLNEEPVSITNAGSKSSISKGLCCRPKAIPSV